MGNVMENDEFKSFLLKSRPTVTFTVQSIRTLSGKTLVHQIDENYDDGFPQWLENGLPVRQGNAPENLLVG